MLRHLEFAVVLLLAVFLAGVSFAQDAPMRDNHRLFGFGSGSGMGSGGIFGSTTGLESFGGSMSSRGTVCTNYGFGTGFKPETDHRTGPLTSGTAWSTGRTENRGGGWHPEKSSSEEPRASAGGFNPTDRDRSGSGDNRTSVGGSHFEKTGRGDINNKPKK